MTCSQNIPVRQECTRRAACVPNQHQWASRRSLCRWLAGWRNQREGWLGRRQGGTSSKSTHWSHSLQTPSLPDNNMQCAMTLLSTPTDRCIYKTVLPPDHSQLFSDKHKRLGTVWHTQSRASCIPHRERRYREHNCAGVSQNDQLTEHYHSQWLGVYETQRNPGKCI